MEWGQSYTAVSEIGCIDASLFSATVKALEVFIDGDIDVLCSAAHQCILHLRIGIVLVDIDADRHQTFLFGCQQTAIAGITANAEDYIATLVDHALTGFLALGGIGEGGDVDVQAC